MKVGGKMEYECELCLFSQGVCPECHGDGNVMLFNGQFMMCDLCDGTGECPQCRKSER